MIHSYTKLGGRYMKVNKRRTIYTLIGIILSVALITSIGLFLKGLEHTQIIMTQREYGAFHLAIKNPSMDTYQRIIGNPKVKRVGLAYTHPSGNLNESVKAFGYTANKEAMELMPYHIKAGRLPSSEGEVAMEDWAIKYLGINAKPGTNVTLNGRNYLLTGTLENSIQNQQDRNAVLLNYSQQIDVGKSIMLVEFKPHNGLRKTIDQIEKKLPAGSFGENISLLVWLGAAGDTAGMTGLYMVLAIIIGIVFVATVAMIYNAFQISVVERMKQFGLLRAIGATPAQIRKLVYKEASILSIIGIPIGLFCGVIGIFCIAFAFKIIGGSSVYVLYPVISLQVLILSGGVSLLAIYCSALLPATHAGKISPLIAISSRAFIRKERNKKTRVYLMGRVFGVNGTMAVKNIRRNTKRYRITVFSIVISIVLFITFKSFMDMSLNVSSNLNESDNIHFSVARTVSAADENYSISEEIEKKIKELPEIASVYRRYSPERFVTTISEKQKIAEVDEIGTVYNKGDQSGLWKLECALQGYDAGEMKATGKYIIEGTADEKAVTDGNGVLIIEKNILRNEKTSRNYYGKLANYKVGDMISVGDGKDSVKLKVMGIMKVAPYNYYESDNILRLITTEAVTQKLMSEHPEALKNKEKGNRITSLMLQVKDPKEEKEIVKKLDRILGKYPQVSLTNEIDQNRQGKTGTLMVQILLYGFVVVISLIGSVNIFNTHTTNIILRRRELATLKAVGMGQKGLRRMILLEGMIYGASGVFYGSIIGTGFSYWIYTGISEVREQLWNVPYQAILIAGIAVLLVSYLSVLIPLKRINQDNLIDTIRDDY